MTESSLCPSCESPMPENAPAGMCPKCLMQAAIHGPDEPEVTVTPMQNQAFIPPDVTTLSEQLAQLDVERLIGCGGMGAVYKAKQIKLDRTVALKVLHSDSAEDSSFAERFNREARTLARLSHPNIVGIHDFGEFTVTDDTGNSQTLFYFVMEYVDGSDLRQIMSPELSPEEALMIVSQVCNGLQYAHEQGVVHRDIKPENILLDAHGKVKIADFGLAKPGAAAGIEYSLTGTHQVMGTPRYMAPEQMEGSRTVDHRVDVYSLGVVLYEMLTGEIPMGQFEPPSHKTELVSHCVDDVVLRAMAREPERRFQSADEMMSSLLAAADGTADKSWNLGKHGPSTIMDIGVEKAVAFIKRGAAPNTTRRWLTPGTVSFVLCLAALVAHFVLGIKMFADPDNHDVGFVIASGFVLFTLLLILFAGGASRRTLWRPFVVITAGLAVAILDGIYAEFRMDAMTGKQLTLIGTLGLCGVALMLTAAWDFRRHISRAASRKPKNNAGREIRRDAPEAAHVGFVVPRGNSPDAHIAPHFLMLGYKLTEQTRNEWRFERGSKTGHMGIDLRKCFTVLTVRTGPRPDGSQWLSCGWAVDGFVTATEIPKLEEEGQSFARTIGVETVTLTKSESKLVQPMQYLMNVLGSNSRTGSWKPPARLNAFNMLGSTELDFRETELEPGVHTVSVQCMLGLVEIIVPPEIPVEVTGVGLLGAFSQDAKDRIDTIPPGSPILRITGAAILGAVNVETKARIDT